MNYNNNIKKNEPAKNFLEDRAKWDPKKAFSAKGRYVPGHSPWLCGQLDITGLKGPSEASGLLKHVMDNSTRRDGRDLLNPAPAVKNQLALSNEQAQALLHEWEAIDVLQQKQRKFNAKHHRKISPEERIIDTGKGAKIGRFGVIQLNLNPMNPENGPVIASIYRDICEGLEQECPGIRFLGLHMNEVSPGIHFWIPAYETKDRKVVFEKGSPFTGPDRRAFLEKLHAIVNKANERAAVKYGLDYRQEPVTEKGQDREIGRFRRAIAKREQGLPMSKDESSAFNRVLQIKLEQALQQNKTKTKTTEPAEIAKAWAMVAAQIKLNSERQGRALFDPAGHLLDGQERMLGVYFDAVWRELNPQLQRQLNEELKQAKAPHSKGSTIRKK